MSHVPGVEVGLSARGMDGVLTVHYRRPRKQITRNEQQRQPRRLPRQCPGLTGGLADPPQLLVLLAGVEAIRGVVPGHLVILASYIARRNILARKDI